MRTSTSRHVCVAVTLLLTLAAPAAAQQFEILHGFQSPLADAKAPMVLAGDDALYGVLATGGKGGVGAIFVSRPQSDGSVMTTILHEFDRSQDGAVVDALVEGENGWLYGVAPQHGANGGGTIFKFQRVTGQFTVIHAFSGADGAQPRGPLVAATDGNYYGMTTVEGPNGMGTVFKLTAAGVVTTLYAFSDGPASGLLVQASDGNLYGTNGEHIFRVTLGGARTILHTLGGTIPLGVPPIPTGLVEGADGNLYGVLANQPIGNHFFRMTLDGSFAIIYSSNFSQIDDGNTGLRTPLFVAADGSLIGTLPFAGALDHGTLFRMTTTGTFSVLHTFTPAEGRAYSGIVRHPNGFFYGTTVEGGLTGHGMIYSVGLGGAIDVRYTFRPIHPYAPSAPPIDGPDGALYGTTVAGGLFNLGTVYRLNASGLTVLHHFFGLDGAHPVGKLALGPDGRFYGTTYDGGDQNRGTIFRISPAGAFQRLHTFTLAQGRNPTAGVVLGNDGNYFGTTLLGGTGDSGTAFKISQAGVYTQFPSFVIEVFNSNSMGYPYGGLVQGQDGNFYGGTVVTVGSIGGALFRLTPAGDLTRVHVFSGDIGIGGPQIYGSLAAGSDGQLYGAACCGGAGGGPSSGDRPQIFRFAPVGGRTTLRLMDGVFAGLTEGSDGAFYGATNTATLFRIESDGNFAELKTLTELEGVFPSGVRNAGDWIMGSAYAGGPSDGGVIFRFKRD